MLDGFIGFFKGVGEVFNTLARLLPNFPKFVLCFVKLTIVVVLNWLISIPGMDVVITFLIHVFNYLLIVIIKIVAMACMFAVVGLVAAVDTMFAQKKNGVATGNNSLGGRLKYFVTLFTTCLNDPRAWFTVKRWHASNAVATAFGIYPCMNTCFGGYEPMAVSNGLLCKMSDPLTPEYCSAASVTRVAEGLPYRPLPGSSLSNAGCADVEAKLSAAQKNLVDSVCVQPQEYDNDFLRAVCFDRYCANPSSEDHGPRSCAALVPYQSRERPPTQQLVFVPILFIAGVQAFYTMVSSIASRQADYSAK